MIRSWDGSAESVLRPPKLGIGPAASRRDQSCVLGDFYNVYQNQGARYFNNWAIPASMNGEEIVLEWSSGSFPESGDPMRQMS